VTADGGMPQLWMPVRRAALPDLRPQALADGYDRLARRPDASTAIAEGNSAHECGTHAVMRAATTRDSAALGLRSLARIGLPGRIATSARPQALHSRILRP
jgi:hypothetical protein